MAGRQVEALRGLLQSPDWTREQLHDYQSARLRALVRHAWERVPFYRRRMEAAGLHWGDIRGLEDLSRIPVTERLAARSAAPEELLAKGVNPKTLVVHYTSGGTGQPLIVRRTNFEDRLLHAFRLRAMFGYGMRWRDRRASVRSFNASENTWWVKLGLLEQHTLSSADGPQALRARLLALRPDVIGGFTLTLATIADVLTENDRESIRPRFVVAGGETVMPSLRQRISEGFGARVYDVYGSEEFNLIAAECPQTGLMHVTEASVIAEVLRDGRTVRPGETGEFVATALHSYAMPFLRLHLGDLVRKGPDQCPCGALVATLEQVEGRDSDTFRLPDGSALHPFSLVKQLMICAPWVRQFQIVQEQVDLVRLKVIAPPEVTDGVARLADWLRFSQDKCGQQVRFVIEQVDHIPLDASGKFRALRSLVHRH